MQRLVTDIQEELLALLCYDVDAGTEAATLVRPSDFDERVFRDLVELVFDYRRRYGIPPGTDTPSLFSIAAERDPEHAVAYDKVLTSIEKTKDELNPRFTLDQAGEFVTFQRTREGISKAASAIALNTSEGLARAQAALAESLKVTDGAMPMGFDFGTDLERTVRFLSTPEDSFPTGIRELDRFGLGPARRRLHMMIAPSGKGKSWWLLNLAVQSAKRGYTVLYVSLEMGEDDIAKRLTQRVLAVPSRRTQVSYPIFTECANSADRGLRTRQVRVDTEWSLADEGAEERARRELSNIAGMGRIWVVEFPTGSLSVDQLDSYLSVMRDRQKLKPDLVLVDYADIMKPPPEYKGWEGAIKIGEELRALAQKRNVAMATVSQATSSGLKAKTVDVEHTADARGKIGTADVIMTYSQSDAERERGIARIFVAKARQEQDRFTVLVSQSYDTGHFVRSSTRMGANYALDTRGES